MREPDMNDRFGLGSAMAGYKGDTGSISPRAEATCPFSFSGPETVIVRISSTVSGFFL
ncbi:hypothetical protein GHJ82_14475 [Sinorhizobium saheli]|nr:hypothetical protein [Sinorhizobium saheli]